MVQNPVLPILHSGMFAKPGKVRITRKHAEQITKEQAETFDSTIMFYARMNGMEVSANIDRVEEVSIITWYPKES